MTLHRIETGGGRVEDPEAPGIAFGVDIHTDQDDPAKVCGRGRFRVTGKSGADGRRLGEGGWRSLADGEERGDAEQGTEERRLACADWHRRPQLQDEPARRFTVESSRGAPESPRVTSASKPLSPLTERPAFALDGLGPRQWDEEVLPR